MTEACPFPTSRMLHTHNFSQYRKVLPLLSFICCYHCLGNTYLMESMRSSCWEETQLTMPKFLIFMKTDRPCLQGVTGVYELSAKKLKPFRLSIKLNFLIQPFIRLPCLWTSQWDEKLLMLIITCNRRNFYRNRFLQQANSLTLRTCPISKRCFQQQRNTSEGCVSSSGSKQKVFLSLWFTGPWNSKKNCKEDSIPWGIPVTSEQSVTLPFLKSLLTRLVRRRDKCSLSF